MTASCASQSSPSAIFSSDKLKTSVCMLPCSRNVVGISWWIGKWCNHHNEVPLSLQIHVCIWGRFTYWSAIWYQDSAESSTVWFTSYVLQLCCVLWFRVFMCCIYLWEQKSAVKAEFFNDTLLPKMWPRLIPVHNEESGSFDVCAFVQGKTRKEQKTNRRHRQRYRQPPQTN